MWRAFAGAVVLAFGGALIWWQASPPADLRPQDRAIVGDLPQGPLRITAFGTSLTARYDWPTQLETRLRACTGREITVTKVARSGANVTWALTQPKAVAATAPDLVLIEFAINDADLRDGVRLDKAFAAHQSLISELRARVPDAALALMTMSPAQGPRGWVRPWLSDHYLQYRALAEMTGTGLIDLYPRWLERPRAARGLADDGLHPDPDTAAEIIVPALTQALFSDCSTPHFERD